MLLWSHFIIPTFPAQIDDICAVVFQLCHLAFSFPEPMCLLVSTKTWSSGFHSGQTTGHSREHARDLALPVTFPRHPTKFPRLTFATRAISVLSSVISLLQTFFTRVLLLRQQPFSSENLPPERPTTTIAIKTQVFMFRYELVNSTRKFTIVAEIVSLLKKIYKETLLLELCLK